MKAISKNKALSLALFLGSLHVLCDLVRSGTFFPIVHYGMYSLIEPRQKSYLSYELVVNGKKLDALDFRIHIWEALTNPLSIHEKIRQNNDFEKEKNLMKVALDKLNLSTFYAFIDSRLSNIPEDNVSFALRYKKYLTSVLKQPIDRLQVLECEYGYENSRYFLINKTILINE